MDTQEKVGWLLFFLLFIVPAIRAVIKNWRKTYKDYEALRLEHKKRMDDYAAEVSVLESQIRGFEAENAARLSANLDAGISRNGLESIRAANARLSNSVNRRADRDYQVYLHLREEWGDSLESIIRQSAHLVAEAPNVTSLKVMCSTDLPLLSEVALANYLDELEVNIAFVQGKTVERPLEIAVRHEDGDWKLLNDGFHHMIFVNGKLSGVPDPGVQGVGRPEQPIHRPRPRFGAHIARQVGE